MSNPLLSDKDRELLDFSMYWMDERWSDKSGLLDQYPQSPNHVRGTVWYATGLLMRQNPGDVKRATQALTSLLSYQWTDQSKSNHGCWARHPAEFSSQPAEPVEAKDFDANWREFIAVSLILILEEFAPLLDQKLRQELRLAINRAAEGSYRRQVWALYSNIALLSAFLMDWAGEKDKRPEWQARADQLARQIHLHFKECKNFPEYNSPTYYGVILFALVLWRKFAPSAKLRQMGSEMESDLWRDVGRLYHAGMRNLCGPWSRSYGMDMEKYWALLGVWIALDDNAAPPLPMFYQPIGHAADITMTPAIVLLGAKIPVEVQPHLATFTGERFVEKVIQLKPHRVATSWLSDTLMIGAEADGPVLSTYTDHRDPIIFHWRSSKGVGWGRVKSHMPANASALKLEARAEFFPRYDLADVNKIEIELSVEGLKPEHLSGSTWELPGLALAVTGNLGKPRIELTESGLIAHYPEMAQAAGSENPWIHMAFTKTPPACPQKSAQGILPEFSYRGLILQAENLRYAPHPDIIFPSVIATDSRWEKPLGKFHLYYAPHDEPGGICLAYADSPVGPWTEYNQNPLIQKSWPPHYEVSHVSSPHAVWNEEENRLFLYFHGENNTTRYAVSRDGVHFTYGDVAVNTDMLGANLVEASYARVFRHLHDSGRMRYAMIVMGNKQGTRNLYVASSPDGRKWQARTEPLVTPPPGTNQTGAGWLFSHQEKLYLLDFANQDDSHQYYPLSNLYLHELDTELTHAEFKGLLIHHKAVGEDNCRINDPCLLVHHGTVYLYVNLGKRRHQQIGLMTAILS